MDEGKAGEMEGIVAGANPTRAKQVSGSFRAKPKGTGARRGTPAAASAAAKKVTASTYGVKPGTGKEVDKQTAKYKKERKAWEQKKELVRIKSKYKKKPLKKPGASRDDGGSDVIHEFKKWMAKTFG